MTSVAQKTKAGRSPVTAADGPRPKPNSSPTVAPSKSNEDVALVWGKREDGGMNILRKRQDRIEAGTVQPLKEGVPIHGEVIQLRPRPDSPLCDVEVQVPAPSASSIPRPAQVATDSYRKNWDQVYRRKRGTTNDKLLN